MNIGICSGNQRFMLGYGNIGGTSKYRAEIENEIFI